MNVFLFLIYLSMKILDILLNKEYQVIKKDIDTLIPETLEHHGLFLSDDQYAVVLGVFAYHLNIVESSGWWQDFTSYRRYVVHLEEIKRISSSDMWYKVIKQIIRNSQILWLHDSTTVIDASDAMDKTKLFIGLISQHRFNIPEVLTLEWALKNQ